MEKAVDLFMWEMKIGNRDKILPIIWRLADDLEPKHGIRIRNMSRRSLRRDLDAFGELYNEAWARNWGFVPYSKEDLDAYAQELHLVFDPAWFMVAETAEGETVGVAITIPDINQVLKRMNGRLLPLGWWHYLRRRSIVDRCRIGFLGVKPAYQHTGVAAALLHPALPRVRAVADQVGRGGLGARDEQGPEPRDGGPGRTNRQEIPGLRARSLTCRSTARVYSPGARARSHSGP